MKTFLNNLLTLNINILWKTLYEFLPIIIGCVQKIINYYMLIRGHHFNMQMIPNLDLSS